MYALHGLDQASLADNLSAVSALLIHPDDRERVRAEMAKMVAERQVVPMEFRVIRRDGEERIMRLSGEFEFDARGQPVKCFGIHQDITERKRAEDTLRRTLTDLQRSNADLERFAYVASHDLQEPLRMVASYVQLLRMRYQGQLDADADEFIGFAWDGAQRMQRLLLDLLEFSRAGSRGALLQPTDATAACRAAMANLEVAITESGANVSCDPLPMVHVDASQLEQLFQNLIGNALKFRDTDSPRVHISARQTFEVSETSKAAAKVWEFAVRDNGIGIDPEYFDRIFIVFQRLHAREEYPGTGIGLAICKRIVERHGGRIWVESAAGQGSTFYFTLPA